MSSQRAPPICQHSRQISAGTDSAGLPAALHTCATGKQGRISFSFFICRPRLFGRSADRASYNTFIISNQEKFGNTAAADSIPPQKSPRPPSSLWPRERSWASCSNFFFGSFEKKMQHKIDSIQRQRRPQGQEPIEIQIRPGQQEHFRRTPEGSSRIKDSPMAAAAGGKVPTRTIRSGNRRARAYTSTAARARGRRSAERC